MEIPLFQLWQIEIPFMDISKPKVGNYISHVLLHFVWKHFPPLENRKS